MPNAIGAGAAGKRKRSTARPPPRIRGKPPEGSLKQLQRCTRARLRWRRRPPTRRCLGTPRAHCNERLARASGAAKRKGHPEASHRGAPPGNGRPMEDASQRIGHHANANGHVNGAGPTAQHNATMWPTNVQADPPPARSQTSGFTHDRPEARATNNAQAHMGNNTPQRTKLPHCSSRDGNCAAMPRVQQRPWGPDAQPNRCNEACSASEWHGQIRILSLRV